MGECAQTHGTRMKKKDKEVAVAERTGGKEAEKVERRVTVAEDEGNRISFPFAKEEEARREPRNADSTNRSVPLEVCADGEMAGEREKRETTVLGEIREREKEKRKRDNVGGGVCMCVPPSTRRPYAK